MKKKTQIKRYCTGILVAASVVGHSAAWGQVLLSEDFEGLPLEPFVNEISVPPGTDFAKIWTNTPPEGWVIDNSGVPSIGIEEEGMRDWEGWTFTNVQAWTIVAGDQRRSEFAKAQGVVMVADPDEWDDKGNPEALGTYNSFISTPPIAVSGGSPATLTFDSSWRPEDTQTANLRVAFDGGESQELFVWSSNSNSLDFKDDNSTNDTITQDIEVPAGVSEMVLTFGMFDATNDWWWAIDNMEIIQDGSTIYNEDFEGLELRPFVDEEQPDPPVGEVFWTKTPPEGWEVDDFEMPFGGVDEWRGWSFADAIAWGKAAGDDGRLDFINASGISAIADPDEWDDKEHDPGTFSSILISPEVSLSEINADTLFLSFDSSWRPEDNQTALLRAEFSGAGGEDILFWTSAEGDAFFKPDAINERLTFSIEVPNGASSVQFRWELFDAGNDWWWAIDNVVLSTEEFTAIKNWQVFE